MRMFVATVLAACTGLASAQGSDPSAACFRAMAVDPIYEPLKEKIGAPVGQTGTVEQMARSDKATEEDKALLSKLASERQRCTEVGDDYRLRFAAPGIAQAVTWQQGALIRAIVELYAGRTTYGEFNIRRKELADEFKQRIAQVSQQAAQAQAQSEAQRAAALREENANVLQMMQALQPRPQFVPLPSPAVNCTTQRNGVMSYTRCQ